MLLNLIMIASLLSAGAACYFSGGFAGIGWIWILPITFAASFIVFVLLAVLFVWVITLFVNTNKPQLHDSKFFRKLIGVYVEAIIKILRMQMHTQGLEKIPADGRFLLVCNHLFDLDPVVLLHYFNDKQLAFISKRENTTMFVVGKVMHKIMCQLINRENDREALKTILKCIQLIKDDEVSVAVFPEGYCSLDGRLQHFRAGAFKIATKTNVPIVVCTVQNTTRVVGNILRGKPTDIHLHLVDVIQPEEYQGKTATEISERVFNMMLTDLGPKFAPLEEKS